MLPILSDIKPHDIKRKSNTIKLYQRALKDQIRLLHTVSSYNQNIQRLASRESLTTKFKQIKIQSAESSFWAHNKWNEQLNQTKYKLKQHINTPRPKPPGYNVPRAQ